MSQFKVGDRVRVGEVPLGWWFKQGWVGILARENGHGNWDIEFDPNEYGEIARDNWGYVSSGDILSIEIDQSALDYYDAITEHSLPPAEPQD